MVILYYLFRGFGWMVARLPFPVLYVFSTSFTFVLHHLVRYRRKVIRANLERAFPEKTPKEIRRIMHRFYRNLADIALEVMKLETISPEEMKRRFSFDGIDIIRNSFERGRSIIVAVGHCGNWEWMGTALGVILQVKGHAVVKPLSDKRFQGYMQMLRHRLNPDSTVPFRNTYRAMVRNRANGVSITLIASDQTPVRDETNHWFTFLNQDTLFFTGIERLARTLDFDVVYIDIVRTGRGHYHGDIRLVTGTPKATADFEITENYIRMLEDSIRRSPDNWLWSHRRWKHKRMETTT